jgi:hypothetical protein
MRYDLEIRGQIKSLLQEEQDALEKEARDYEECKDALAELGINPIDPDTNRLREILFERHYKHKLVMQNVKFLQEDPLSKITTLTAEELILH